MKLVAAVLVCFLACCLARQRQPCASPPLLTGELTVSTQNEKLWTYIKFEYDGLGQRMRLKEYGVYDKKEFMYDVLLMFREATMYEIHNQTCIKRPLKVDFQPIQVPKNASLLGEVVLGSSSVEYGGLLVDTWTGDVPDQGKYMMTVTVAGCIPVSTMYHTTQFGWVLSSFFNIVVGISDPGELNPPDFCSDAKMDFTKEHDFFSLFLKK